MGKKKQAKKVLLELYDYCIEEYCGAQEIVDIVWGDGTSQRWTDRHNDKLSAKRYQEQVVDPIPDLDFDETPPIRWVETSTEEGFKYYEWKHPSESLVGVKVTQEGRDIRATITYPFDKSKLCEGS